MKKLRVLYVVLISSLFILYSIVYSKNHNSFCDVFGSKSLPNTGSLKTVHVINWSYTNINLYKDGFKHTFTTTLLFTKYTFFLKN